MLHTMKDAAPLCERAFSGGGRTADEEGGGALSSGIVFVVEEMVCVFVCVCVCVCERV